MVIEANELHNKNVPAPIAEIVDGMVIDAKEEHCKNA
jgi:hypothetical protein